MSLQIDKLIALLNYNINPNLKRSLNINDIDPTRNNSSGSSGNRFYDVNDSNDDDNGGEGESNMVNTKIRHAQNVVNIIKSIFNDKLTNDNYKLQRIDGEYSLNNCKINIKTSCKYWSFGNVKKIFTETGENYIENINFNENNIRTGKYEYIDKLHKKIIQAEYKDNLLTGEFKVYHYKEIKLNTKKIEQTKTLILSIDFFRGEPSGNYVEYCLNTYIDNIAPKPLLLVYKRGFPRKNIYKEDEYYINRVNIRNSIINNLTKNRSRKITQEKKLICKCNFKKGKLHGKYKEWYMSNFMIKYNIDYQNGKYHGYYQKYRENGYRMIYTYYRYGELDGLYKRYNQKGNIAYMYIYNNGVFMSKLKI